jgi:hypothetical protein
VYSLAWGVVVVVEVVVAVVVVHPIVQHLRRQMLIPTPAPTPTVADIAAVRN